VFAAYVCSEVNASSKVVSVRSVSSSSRRALLTRSNACSMEISARSCTALAFNLLHPTNQRTYHLIPHLIPNTQHPKPSRLAVFMVRKRELLHLLPDLEVYRRCVPCHGPLCVFVEDDVRFEGAVRWARAVESDVGVDWVAEEAVDHVSDVGGEVGEDVEGWG
jgi:hypothetical protein